MHLEPVLVLLFPIGGVSPLLGLEPVLFRERVHRLTVYTLFEDTSSMVGRILKGLKETGVLREAPANGTSARKRHRPRPYAVRKPKGYTLREPGPGRA